MKLNVKAEAQYLRTFGPGPRSIVLLSLLSTAVGCRAEVEPAVGCNPGGVSADGGRCLASCMSDVECLASERCDLKQGGCVPLAPEDGPRVLYFEASESPVPKGTQVELRYAALNAKEVWIDPIGRQDPSKIFGQILTEPLVESTSFLLRATGGGIEERRTVNVDVLVDVDPIVINSFTIAATGQCDTLQVAWDVTAPPGTIITVHRAGEPAPIFRTNTRVDTRLVDRGAPSEHFQLTASAPNAATAVQSADEPSGPNIPLIESVQAHPPTAARLGDTVLLVARRCWPAPLKLMGEDPNARAMTPDSWTEPYWLVMPEPSNSSSRVYTFVEAQPPSGSTPQQMSVTVGVPPVMPVIKLFRTETPTFKGPLSTVELSWAVEPPGATVTISDGSAGGTYSGLGNHQSPLTVTVTQTTQFTIGLEVPGGADLGTQRQLTVWEVRDEDANLSEQPIYQPSGGSDLPPIGRRGRSALRDEDVYTFTVETDELVSVQLFDRDSANCVGRTVTVSVTNDMGEVASAPSRSPAMAGRGCPSFTTGPQRMGSYRLHVSSVPVLNYDVIVHPHAPVCGDHVQEGGEECDDGNTSDGDGCARDCKVEDLFVVDVQSHTEQTTALPNFAAVPWSADYSGWSGTAVGWHLVPLEDTLELFGNRFQGLIVTANGLVLFAPPDFSDTMKTPFPIPFVSGPFPYAFSGRVGVERVGQSVTVHFGVGLDNSPGALRYVVTPGNIAVTYGQHGFVGTPRIIPTAQNGRETQATTPSECAVAGCDWVPGRTYVFSRKN